MRTASKLIALPIAGLVSLAGLTATAAPASALPGPTFELIGHPAVLEQDGVTAVAEALLIIDGAHPQPITLDLTILNGGFHSASPSDFAQAMTFKVVVPANVEQFLVPVKVKGDELVEQDELFKLRLNGASQGSVTGLQITGKINNDDRPHVSFGDAVAVEADDHVAIKVPWTVDQAFTANTLLKAQAFKAPGCTATPSVDFAIQPTQEAVQNGATSGFLFAHIEGDDISEGTECFGFHALPGVGIEVGDFGTVTIKDDEPALPQDAAPAPQDNDQPGPQGENPAPQGDNQSNGSDDADTVDGTDPEAPATKADTSKDSGSSTVERSDRERDDVEAASTSRATHATQSADGGLPIGLLLGAGLITTMAVVAAARRRRSAGEES